MDDLSAVSALLHKGSLSFSGGGAGGEDDVWDWLKRVTVEFDALRVTNAKLATRVQQLERMTGGVGALSDEEFLAELPNRMSKALRSAQQVGQEIVKQATSRETAVLQRAAEEAAEIRRDANAQAREVLERASQDARNRLEEARRFGKELTAQAEAQRDHVLAELGAQRDELHQGLDRLEADRVYLRQVFVSVKRALERPSQHAGIGRPDVKIATEVPSEPAAPRGPSRPRPRHPRNGSRLARPDEPRQQTDLSAGADHPQEDGAPRTTVQRPVNVLFLCGANVCASPMAALLLGRRLAELGVPAIVSSAGLSPRGQRPPAPVIEVLRDRGLELAGHRSTVLSPQLLNEADLVLGMADQHVHAAAHLAPQSWPYTFSLKELVRYDQVMRQRRRDEPLEDILALVHHARSQQKTRSASGGTRYEVDLGDYVADVTEYSYEACVRVAKELEQLIDRLVGFLWWNRVPRRDASGKVFDDASS